MLRFDDRDFRFSHGKAPRGRGSWAFGFGSVVDGDAAWFAPSGTFAEAKKAARAEASRRGFKGVIFVLA